MNITCKAVWVVIFLLITITSSGQLNRMEIPAETGATVNYAEQVVENVNLGDNGYLVKTAHPLQNKSQKITIYYFSSDGSLVWKNKIESSHYRPTTRDILIASPDGSVIYDVQVKVGSQQVHRLLTDGTIKTTDLSKYKLHNNIQSVFCDKDFLYFLTTKDGNEAEKNKKPSEQLILHRFSNSDFSYKSMPIKLPAVAASRNTTFWYYLGDIQGKKYLISKTVDMDEENYSFDLIPFNTEGVAGKKVTISFKFDGYDLKKFHGNVPNTGSYRFRNLNQSAAPFQTEAIYYDVDVLDVDRICAFIDPFHGSIYFSGVLEKAKSSDRSFFIKKYSPEGKEIWSVISESSLNKQDYNTQGNFDYLIAVLPSETVNVTYTNRGSRFLHEVSPTGTIVASKELKDWTWGSIIGLHNGKLPRAIEEKDRLSDKSLKFGTFDNYVSSKVEIDVFSDRKGMIYISSNPVNE